MKKHLFIVTGSSRGMGLAMARQLMAADTVVVGMARGHAEALTGQAREMQQACHQIQTDLSHAGSAADALQAWLAQHAAQPGDWLSATLVNNAGVIAQSRPMHSIDQRSVVQALRVGVEAPMLLTSVFLAHTRDWPVQRKVLNISSGLGRRAMASQAAYCAAKAGLDHFTRCLALEEGLRPDGARVCALAPGVIDTDMQSELRSGTDADFPDRRGFEALKANGQLTTAEDAARRVLAYLSRSDFGSIPVADIREV